jgi:hypothetical protein
MKTKNKVSLVNMTTGIMVVTISIVAIWFIGFVVTSAFDLNVFTRRTSDFLLSFIGFSAVLIFCSAILNISLNIGIIADSRVSAEDNRDVKKLNKNLYLSVLVGIVLFIAFLFLGDFLTRKYEKDKLVDSSDYVIKTYSETFNKIAQGLTDTSRVKNIPESLRFLSNLKSEFPSVDLITSGTYNGQLTFLELTQSDSWKSLKEPLFGNSFYKCTDFDCKYLTDFFTRKTNDNLFWTKESDYKLYYPFDIKGTRFIIVFSKYERNGKIGS